MNISRFFLILLGFCGFLTTSTSFAAAPVFAASAATSGKPAPQVQSNTGSLLHVTKQPEIDKSMEQSLAFLNINFINTDLAKIPLKNGHYLQLSYFQSKLQAQSRIELYEVGIDLSKPVEVGYISYQPTNSINHTGHQVVSIVYIYVQDIYQNKGLGTILLLSGLYNILINKFYQSSCAIVDARETSEKMFKDLGFEFEKCPEIQAKYKLSNGYDKHNYWTEKIPMLLNANGPKLYAKALIKLRTGIK